MYDWQEYLHLARKWSTFPEEGNLRSAVSRAYYAVFCTCRNWVAEHHQSHSFSKTSSVHLEVAQVFAGSDDEQKRSIGEILGRLRKFRNKADYDNKIKVSQHSVETSLQDAERLLHLLASLQSPKQDPES